MINKPLIIWEKWINPLFDNTNKEIDDEDIEPYSDYEDNNETQDHRMMHMVMTPMGIIPFEEIKDCDKVFNFWTGHTNFTISKAIAKLIENIDGVETLDVFTRYRFRVGFGKAFKDGDVMNNINDTVYSKLTHYDNI
jgi:hypothetical protein